MNFKWENFCWRKIQQGGKEKLLNRAMYPMLYNFIRCLVLKSNTAMISTQYDTVSSDMKLIQFLTVRSLNI